MDITACVFGGGWHSRAVLWVACVLPRFVYVQSWYAYAGVSHRYMA